MLKTPQHHKRESIRQLFRKVLKQETIKLTPKSVSMLENFEKDPIITEVNFEYFHNDKEISLRQTSTAGLVDCLFTGLRDFYIDDYHSISNIRLLNLSVTPIMNTNRNLIGSDAKVSLDFMVEVKDHGCAEFLACSRSLIGCITSGTLEVFQFYLNCHKTFVKLKEVMSDAKERNRWDLVQSFVTDLTFLTDVNSYYEKEI